MFVGVVLMEVDPQRIWTVGCVDPEDDVREATDEPEPLRFDRILGKGTGCQSPEPSDLTDLGEGVPRTHAGTVPTCVRCPGEAARAPPNH